MPASRAAPNVPRIGSVEIQALDRCEISEWLPRRLSGRVVAKRRDHLLRAGSRFKGRFIVERLHLRSKLFFADVGYSIKIGPVLWEATIVLKPPPPDPSRKVRMTQSDKWDYILDEFVRLFGLGLKVKMEGKERFRILSAEWKDE